MLNINEDIAVQASTFSGMPSLKNLKDNDGKHYSQFKKKLTIRYGMLLRDMLIPWAMICLAIYLYPNNSHIFLKYALIILMAAWFAFWLNAFNLFFHEAAHYNLNKNRFINDLIATALLTPFVGMPISLYRRSHWMHHRFLGKFEDTEISYRQALTTKNLIIDLFGVYLFRMVKRYFNNFKSANVKGNAGSNSSNLFIYCLFLMLSTQILIIFFLSFFVSPYIGASWAISTFIFTPFISKIRQTLEHRSLNSGDEIDYSKVEHGPVNRIFGQDIFSRYFGAAGFNSHLLHHCDPQISYTRFKEMEIFILNTPLSDFIKKNRATYFMIFQKLIRNG